MKRNVIKLGQSTLVVSLPTKWAEEQGIKPKSEIDVEEDGAALHIRPTLSVAAESHRTLEFTEKDWQEPRPEKYVQRMLATAYKQGISTITIKCKSKVILDYIEQRIDGFIGLEIVEQKKDALILKTVAASEEANFQTVMSRALNLSEHIAHGTAEAMRSNDKGEKQNLLRLERTHNKVTDYLKRIVCMRRMTWEDKYLYSFVAELERLVDSFKHLLSIAKISSKKTLLLLDDVVQYVLLVLAIYAKQESGAVALLSKQYVPLRGRANQLVLDGTDAVAAMHLYQLVVATYELGETILEWKLR